MVPVHCPLTILGRNSCFCPSDPHSFNASMAPCVSMGHSLKERFAAPQSSRTAVLRTCGASWPPNLGSAPSCGQLAPQVLSTAVRELWGAANLSFKLCPMLTQGAIEALKLCGSEGQKQLFLPRMVSGQWTGTMDLTEPQAGSDLAQIRTRAVPDGDQYRLFGQKIFITWGDHDYAENIIHMVLAL